MEVADILSDKIRIRKLMSLQKLEMTERSRSLQRQRKKIYPHSDELATLFRRHSKVNVNSGENNGKPLLYTNVVTLVSKFGTLGGEGSCKMTYNASGSD